MAIISAILSLLSRKLGDLLQALFGWSIRGLFGRLPSKKETALSLALILSVLWPVLIVGSIVPKVAAWLIAFLPLHEWLGKTFLRVMWIVLAVLAPIFVGLITAWVAPTRKQQGSVLRTIFAGYPLTIGMFVSFLLTFFIVPILKVHAMVRGWQDEHVYLQIKENAYTQVLQRLAAACEKAGVAVRDLPIPSVMAAPVRVLKWFARSGIEPVVANDPHMLRGDGVEVYLYPTDVLIRGRTDKARRIRSAMLREMMRGPAYLTQDSKAQKLEDALNRAWETLERHANPDEIKGRMQDRVRELAKEIEEANVAYEDWVLLYTNLQHLDRDVSGSSALVEETARERLPAVADPRPVVSTGDLIRQTLDEAKALLSTEIALARDEAKSQITAMKRFAIAAGIAFVTTMIGLSMLILALILHIAPRPLTGGLIGGVMLAVSAVAAIAGYLWLPKKIAEQTRARLNADAQILKERLV